MYTNSHWRRCLNTSNLFGCVMQFLWWLSGTLVWRVVFVLDPEIKVQMYYNFIFGTAYPVVSVPYILQNKMLVQYC